MKRIDLSKGDIYRLWPGTIFYVQSSLEPEHEKLQIHAIFTNTEEDEYVCSGPLLSKFNFDLCD